jgi:glyoxylase-like metal-dependent hydrolase (beta-lactamase superfamily II)
MVGFVYTCPAFFGGPEVDRLNRELREICMRRVTFLVAAGCVAVAVGLVAQQQPSDPIKAASDALGATSVKTLKFTGFGDSFTVGQSPSPTEAWPKIAVKSYEATLNFETQAMRVDMTREQTPVPPRGGGATFTGEQRLIQVVRGMTAWDEPIPAPAAGGRRGGGPPPEPGRITAQQALNLVGIRPPGPPPPTPQPGAVVDRMVQVYLNPYGFLKGAAANNATTSKVTGGTEVTFTVGGKYKFVGLINPQNEVVKVTTWVDNPVLGDMPVEVTYSNYQAFGEGITYPLHIVQKQGGYPTLDIWLSAVTPGVMAEIEVPKNVADAAAPPVTVASQEIGTGIYYLTGGTHHSVAIEMKDHVILVEAPQNEARAAAVVDKVKELIPGKAIKYVVNTHHHFDHSGGLRTLVDAGATIVTHQIDKPFYEKAWAEPRTISPDRLSQSKKAPVFLTYTDKRVLTDGARTVEIHRIAGNPHADGFGMIYLPAEKLLIEADAFTPGPAAPPAGAAAPAAAPAGGARAGGARAGGARAGGAPPAPAPPNPATVNLYQNVQRLKLDVAQIAALHGPRLATLEDLQKAATPANAGTQ